MAQFAIVNLKVLLHSSAQLPLIFQLTSLLRYLAQQFINVRNRYFLIVSNSKCSPNKIKFGQIVKNVLLVSVLSNQLLYTQVKANC